VTNTLEQDALRIMKESVDLLSKTVSELSGPLALLSDSVVRHGAADTPTPKK
jgi:hypothetical protein